MAADERTEQGLAERLHEAAVAAFDLATVYLGIRLGLYRALADGFLTAAELAARTSCHERYVREWCEQQAATGLIECDDPAAAPEDRRFALPASQRAVLVDRDAARYGAGNVLGLVEALAALPALPGRVLRASEPPRVDLADRAERAGAGEANRPIFRHRLAGWLADIPAVHDRLARRPAARVLDVACGAGWSSLAIAAAYPLAEVDAIDLDEGVIALARRHATGERLADRVRFRVADAADPALAGPYDLVICVEALHDLPFPVAALAAWRRVLAPHGTCLVVDLRAEAVFTAPAGSLERLAYGWSVVDCLPATMEAGAGAGATGAVLRPGTLERYAREGGFAGVEVLPIEDPGWRFYRLVP
jgi:SAM-dependent methyltransferase